jgi:cytochrome P450
MQVHPTSQKISAGAPVGAKSRPGSPVDTAQPGACPFTGETFTQSSTDSVQGCPYMAAKARLEAAAEVSGSAQTPSTATPELRETSTSSAHLSALSAHPSPPLLGVAKALGLEFRKQGRGIDFWRTRFRPISPEKATELASKYKSFEARAANGDWNPVESIEELKALIQAAEKEARKQGMMATGNASAQMVAQSMIGLPITLGTQEMEAPQQVGAPARVGLLTFARGMARHHASPLQFLQEFHAKLGRSFEVKTPTHGNFLFDTRTDVILDALKETDGGDQTFKKSELQGHGAAFLIGKKNMFTSNGEDWAAVQQALRGHLTAKKVNSPEMTERLTAIFDDHLNDLKVLAQASPDGIIEIDSRKAMQTAVLDVAFQLFFSTKLPKEELREVQDAFNTQMSWLPEETVNPTDVSLSHLPGMGQLRQAYRKLDGVADRILSQRRANPHKPGDVLDSFLEAKDPETGGPLPDERIKHEILSLLEAGHETTATMMGWSLMMMARNPEEYNALQTEVDKVIGRDTPDANEVRNMPRTTAIINETLRMYPPFYLFMRQATEDTVIGSPGNQVQVEKGTTLVASLYETNRDEASWGEEKTGFPAHEFHSARFDEKNSERFIPFGAGKRACIGQNLGRLEGNLMLARLAQDFDILPDHEQATIELHSDLSIHPKDGTVRLKLREQPAPTA